MARKPTPKPRRRKRSTKAEALLAKLVRQQDAVIAQNRRLLKYMGELVRKSWTIR